MADRPIIFSAPMVRALLDGRKTQTRRIAKFVKEESDGLFHAFNSGGGTFGLTEDRVPIVAPDYAPYAVGDRLWVREAFSYERLDVDRDGFMPPWYWADGNPSSGDFTKPKPSIHMPRWASRITLTVTDVRVQRLQEISEDDAIAEGISKCGRFFAVDPNDDWDRGWGSATNAFRALWEDINAKRGFGWEANPWVIALSFTVERRNIDEGDVQ